MELHIAIKNLVKYKNTDFINEPQFINALIDFNAFENYPALRNITRILLADGYGKKIKAQNGWNMLCMTMVSDISRDYSFDQTLVEYVLKSIAFGLGYINDVTVPSSNNASSQSNQPNSAQPPFSPSNAKRSQFNLSSDQIDNLSESKQHKYKEDVEDYLDSILEIKGDWVKELGAKFKINSFFDVGDGSFQYNIEIDGKIKNYQHLSFICVAYNDKGRILATEEAYANEMRPYQVLSTGWFSTSEVKYVGNVAKVVMYWKD